MKQIETCKSCSNRKFDTQQGILCSLTDAKPTFESTCPDFMEDEKLVKKEREISQFILPNRKLANATMWIMWLVMVTQLLAVLSHYMNYNLLSSALNGQGISTQAAEDNDLRHILLLLLHYAVFLASAVCFATWFYRAHKNHHTRFSLCNYRKGWAIWGWIVPIASFFIPYEIMKEMYQEAKKKLVQKSEEYASINLSKLIGWWWALWVIANIISNIFTRIFKDEETLEGLMEYSVAEMITCLLMIPAAVLAFKLIKEYSQIEESLLAIEQGNDNKTNHSEL